MAKNFTWKIGEKLPGIEEHSIRKLNVLETYLRAYFDTVVPNPATDTLNITLVDGFCGGGAYSTTCGIQYGSPIILLDAVTEAEQRINKMRDKPLTINARFYFVDEKQEHIENLRDCIAKSQHAAYLDNIIQTRCGKFDHILPEILNAIRLTQRAGRSIFILDQCGYKDVPMESISSIFRSLSRPEVILTFAIDSLLNYLNERSAEMDLYRQFGIDKRFIQFWHNNKNDEASGRLFAQRLLMSNIQTLSGAKFFTPFLLWSRTDSRSMMLAHLSQHQTARDKMLGVHWDIQNTFKHIGRGSLFSLGYDVRIIESKDSLFDFSERDRSDLGQELLSELPREIAKLQTDDHFTVQNLLEGIGNRTAATNHDLCSALSELAKAREIEIFSKKGSMKRQGSGVKMTDNISLAKQGILFRV